MPLRILALLLLVAGASAPAVTQDPYRLKPGAKGKLCLECHVAFEDTTKRPHVHTPVQAGQCSDCHNPHAATHGMLLAAEPEAICSSCHGDVVPASAVSTHPAATDGGCTQCHDPHASENENVLLKAGTALCIDCHADVGEAAANARFSHAPVEMGCTACHDPHASTEAKALLKTGVAALCGECHDADTAAFTARHFGYSVAQSDCTSCHDPHGSNQPAILWADVHKPITTKMCNQCHNDAAAPNPLEVKKTGTDLCRGCHSSEMNQLKVRNRVHWPVTDQTACLNCHEPHASKQSALLTQPTKQLCQGCHEKQVQVATASVTKHPPVNDGDCSVCHAPHAANEVFLLESANLSSICGNCHDWENHSTHPLGEKVVDMRNPNLSVGCDSCHNSHGSQHKSLTLADPGSNLCTDCHAAQER